MVALLVLSFGVTLVSIANAQSSSVPLFSRNLSLGRQAADVRQLQVFLNSQNFILASKGPGSPGQETNFFGPKLQLALSRYQQKEGIQPAVGFFGAITRANVNARLVASGAKVSNTSSGASNASPVASGTSPKVLATPTVPQPISAPPVTPPTIPQPIVTPPAQSTSVSYYDVVIVGGGASGVAAAIQSARMGARTAILEETDWLGGQMTAAGVSSMDEGNYDERTMGIYGEFIQKVKAYYTALGKSISTCYRVNFSNCFEPHIGQKILLDMIAETKNRTLSDGTHPVLDVHLRTPVISATKEGNAVTGVVAKDGSTYRGKVFIEATEYGDLLPLVGARYRAGNSTSDALNQNACIQDITYSAVIKKYPNGLPEGLQMKNKPPGYDAIKPYFEKLVTKNGSDTWDPKEYPINFIWHNAYRGMPDSSNSQNYMSTPKESAALISKTSLNLANDYPDREPYLHDRSIDISPDLLSVRYLEDMSFRKQTNCEAKLKTLQLIYYIQNDLGETSWSVANDEGFDTAYNQENSCANIPQEFKAIERQMTPIPYVRESRRGIGVTTLTAKEIKSVRTSTENLASYPSVVALGYYATDLHNCKDNGSLETGLESRTDISDGIPPFAIPYEALVPEKVDGLLFAEKNISLSRLAEGAAREQPIVMRIGQAAGAAAALAVKQNVQPRQVNPVDIQKVLLADSTPLSLFSFTDVPRTNPLWADIQLVSMRGIMMGSGGGNFDINGILTRDQAAVVLARSFNLPQTVPASPSFADVSASSWAYSSIEAIFRAGLTSGCSNVNGVRNFCPTDPLTKVQFAIFMGKAMGLNPGTAPSTSLFADVPESSFGFQFIQLMAQKGLMGPCSTNGTKNFCPNDSLTRGQVASILAKELLLR